MIDVIQVCMIYPTKKRYREYLFHPFQRKPGTVGVDNASFTIQSGDCVGFLGPNGAGKTTLMKLIGGLIYPTRGTVYVNGFDTSRQNIAVRRSVGFVINEDRSFYWRLTGRQNLEFFGTLENLSSGNLTQRIKLLLQLVGMTPEEADKPVSDYSSGMRQRLAIARGMLSDPEILILDEPTRNLDPLGAEKLRLLIQSEIRKKQAKTLIIATHQIAEAEMLCNKLCLINRGKVVVFETPDELRRQFGDITNCYKTLMSQN